MTDSEIRHIMNILRKGTITWEGRKEALKAARKLVKEELPNGKTKDKFYWQCSKCKEWNRDEKNFEVDHIKEIGSFCGNWDEMVKRIYCRQDNLQVLCLSCHKKKTANFNASIMFKRKRKGPADDLDL